MKVLVTSKSFGKLSRKPIQRLQVQALRSMEMKREDC